MSFEHELASAEAFELHEFLDSKGIPRTKNDPSGKLMDSNQMSCYIIPLIDRVLLFKDS
jgi:hypothetical protein